MDNRKEQVEALRRGRLELAEEMRTRQAALDAKIAEVRKQVVAGEATTGDRITDYFLAVYGVIDDAEVSKPFRELEAQLVGKHGQFVLVVRREKERHVFRGPGQSSESDYHLATYYKLGILNDEKLILDIPSHGHGLPTEAHIDVEINERQPAEKREGPLMSSVFASSFYGLESLGKGISGGRNSGPMLEIIVGCDAVFAYSPPELYAKPGIRPTRSTSL